jgi:hypothetical protein
MSIAIENGLETVRVDELIVTNNLIVGDYQSVLFTNMPAGTKMVFQENAAPEGWIKQTSGIYSDATVMAVTGSIGSGGSLHVKDHIHSGTHTHSINHVHTYNNAAHKHLLVTATINIEDEGSGNRFIYRPGNLTDLATWDTASGSTGSTNISTNSQSVANFGTPSIKYLSSIVCSKI